MTMRELAKLANVSASTVSKAFGGAEDVSDETKEIIFRLAKENGCFEKFNKIKYSKKTIAIICPEIKSPYYAEYVEKLQNIIEENGGIAIVSADNFSADKQTELIEYYSGHLKVDGIFVFQMKANLKKGFSDTPIVAMLSSRDVRVDSVRLDFDAPLREAIEHLYASGHKNILFVGEKLTVYKAEKFEKIARTFPIKHSFFTSEHRFERAGEDGVDYLLQTKDRPTAIICAYDNIAIGVINHLKTKGYNVPDDFSVIGINNINSASFLEVPLSTIDARPDDICMIAWDLLEKKRKNKYYKLNQQITIKGRLLLRNTTKAI